jgi:hypothetical protein
LVEAGDALRIPFDEPKGAVELKAELLSILEGELAKSAALLHTVDSDAERRQMAWLHRAIEDFQSRVVDDLTIDLNRSPAPVARSVKFEKDQSPVPRKCSLPSLHITAEDAPTLKITHEDAPPPDPLQKDVIFLRAREFFIPEGSGFIKVC